MNRRNMLKGVGAAGAGLLAAPGPLANAQQTARRGMPPLKITDVKVIMTQPAGSNLVVVKVMTSEPGLYGVGCATHAERPFAVAAYIDQHLKPFVVGKNCDEIEDIWQSTYVQSYFRAGVTGNNALSGIDGALWDILGKRCGVPVHERPYPNQACVLCKAAEPYRPFFMEDPFSPEDVGWFKILRQQTTTSLAMGELFVNRNEWLPLVSERLIDFIRIHQSAAGGLNQCRKIAACCEFFNVRTAWHGPANVDPIGHAYNLHLDLSTYNFGIQEETVFPAPAQEVFPGTPEIKGGYMYSNDKPGLGIDINEVAAAKYPYTSSGSSRGNDRRLDGSIVRP